VFNEADQFFFADRIEKGRDVGVENEVHSLAASLSSLG
jgi:hypothetical protein